MFFQQKCQERRTTPTLPMLVVVISSHLIIKSISYKLQDVKNFPKTNMEHYKIDKHEKNYFHWFECEWGKYFWIFPMNEKTCSNRLQVHLFNRAIEAAVSGEAVPDPVFPGGLVDPSVFVNVLALSRRNVVPEVPVVNIAVRKPANPFYKNSSNVFSFTSTGFEAKLFAGGLSRNFSEFCLLLFNPKESLIGVSMSFLWDGIRRLLSFLYWIAMQP